MSKRVSKTFYERRGFSHFHSDLLLSAAPVESHVGAIVVSRVKKFDFSKV